MATTGAGYFTLLMLQTNPKDVLTLLEVFRIGLTNRILSARQVIDWADAIILHDEEPDDFIVELAMCGRGNVNELLALLGAYVGEVRPGAAGHATLGLLHHEYAAGKTDLYRVVRTMDWLVVHHQLSEEECRLLDGIEDAYSLAVEGVYGSVAAVEALVAQVLAFFQGFRLDNAAEWPAVDAELRARQPSVYPQWQRLPPLA